MKGNKDKEYIKLRDKFLIGLLCAAIVGVLCLMVVYNRFSFGGSINSKIRKDETFFIYLESYDCSKCADVKKILDDANIEYETMVTSKDTTKNFFKKYNIVFNNDVAPGVIYFKKGKMISNMLEISNMDELKSFLEFYNK